MIYLIFERREEYERQNESKISIFTKKEREEKEELDQYYVVRMLNEL